jgi:hypothetical protein
LGDRWPVALSRNLAPDFTHYLSEGPEMSFQDKSSRKAKPNREKDKMTEKKAKKTIKVRDLAPTKDARGGHRNHHPLLNESGDPKHLPGGGYGNHLVP